MTQDEIEIIKELFQEEYPYISLDLTDSEIEKYWSQDYIKEMPISRALDLFQDYILSQDLASEVYA